MSAALAIPPDAAQARPNHFPLEVSEYQRIVARLENMTGITMGADKRTLVHSRLQRRIRALALPGFRDYCDLLERPEGQVEQTHFVNALTTNLTSFFRESHHFKHFVEEAVQPMLPELKSGRKLRIWSSGCSTGEEPFCIAMMLLSVFPQAFDRNARILATDIDSSVLRTAFNGEYSQERMKGVPDPLLQKFFAAGGSEDAPGYRVNDEVRRLIAFRKLNLNASSWPMRGKFDMIFCRNTLIYFDDDRQSRILKRYRDIMKPGGHLYLGHSERLSGPAEKSFKRVGTTIFQAV
ncbi:protein-glutamate O-methyltransferase CheR [uncultured Algimonas sp.]|uniref:CheR family methyltransferase n=1 Tax=uncultured Algimonas sp. TaxID=1547920 RepID=UPI0026030205|nr:protein-glutamate O-methyltransferase CheR [uncultured Algimonas sp.]